MRNAAALRERRFWCARARSNGNNEQQRQQGVEHRKAAHDARADGEADADAAQRNCRRRRPRIFLEGAHDAEQRDGAGDRERSILGVDEHVSVVERTGGKKDNTDQAGERAAKPPAEPPGDEQADDADRCAHQTARLEQAERQNFGSERAEQIKAAAVHVKIDEPQRALVGKAGRIERHQKVAILRMGVVVPAEAIVAKRCRGDHAGEHQHADGAEIKPACDRDRARRQGYRLRRGLVHDWPGLRGA